MRWIREVRRRFDRVAEIGPPARRDCRACIRADLSPGRFAGGWVGRWEPRAHVTSVQVIREQLDGENVLAIEVECSVISVNTPGSNVIVANVEQNLAV